MFRIRFSDGRVSGGHDTTQACLDVVEARGYPNYWAGHDGDLSEGGDRTLVWATEDDSIDDDGLRAIATIERE